VDKELGHSFPNLKCKFKGNEEKAEIGNNGIFVKCEPDNKVLKFPKYRVRTLNPTLTRWARTPLKIFFSVAKQYKSIAYCIIFAINRAVDSYPKKHEL